MSTDDCASVKQRAKESKAKFLVELQLSLTNTIDITGQKEIRLRSDDCCAAVSREILHHPVAQ